MNTSNTNTQEAVYVDTVAQDFRTAITVVSLAVNLVVFVTWLTLIAY